MPSQNANKPKILPNTEGEAEYAKPLPKAGEKQISQPTVDRSPYPKGVDAPPDSEAPTAGDRRPKAYQRGPKADEPAKG